MGSPEVTVYLDVLFLRVTFLQFLLLYGAGFFLGGKPACGKCFLTALLQGAAWTAMLPTSLPFAILLGMELILTFAGMLYCYGLHDIGIAHGAAALLQTALAMMGRSKPLLLLAVMVLLFLLLIKCNWRKKVCQVQFLYKEKKIHCRAIVDSGNFLREPYGQRPVCILDKSCLGAQPQLQETLLVPYHSVGKPHGLLKVIRIGPVTVDSGRRRVTFSQIYAGIPEEEVGGRGGYQMLLHREYENYL